MRFVIAKYDSFEGFLNLKEVIAESKIEALLKEMEVTEEEMLDALGVEELTPELLAQSSYDGDIPMGILCLDVATSKLPMVKCMS